MTHKEIAKRLRGLVIAARNQHQYQTADRMEELADELDPGRPEPGTVVWCIWFDNDEPVNRLFLSESDAREYKDSNPCLITGMVAPLRLPTRILAPGEVAVKVPPVSEWPDDALRIDSEPYYRMSGTYTKATGHQVTLITRAEAERMEANEDHPDPGEEALSDMLQERIDRVVDYIATINEAGNTELLRLVQILTGEAER